MPAKRRRSVPGQGSKEHKPKGRKTEADYGEDDFFLDQGQDEENNVTEASEEKEEQETAEEKRLRLAKAYLQQLRQTGEFTEGDVSDDGEELNDSDLALKLRLQAQEAGGYVHRQIADRISVPEPSASGHADSSSRFYRCHRESVTALALTHDDAVAYSVGKEGSIYRFDIATGTSLRIDANSSEASGWRRSKLADLGKQRTESRKAVSTGPEWVKRKSRQLGARSLVAAAVSSDGQLLAVGGGDKMVHVWDTRTNAIAHSFPGHKDGVTGLAFRVGTHELYSGSHDRTIKIWSVDDAAYVDTHFGHQADVLCVDAVRQERILSGGYDHTCRVWKVPEQSQLIYRSSGMAVECCKYVTTTEWVTGSNDGSLALWTQLKKKPACVIPGAHSSTDAPVSTGLERSWLQSVAVCRGSDLVASGAGDGLILLWQVEKSAQSQRRIKKIGSFPAKGFVNALAIASSGRFVLAGLGQEPRLGRWAREQKARNGLLLQQLQLNERR